MRSLGSQHRYHGVLGLALIGGLLAGGTGGGLDLGGLLGILGGSGTTAAPQSQQAEPGGSLHLGNQRLLKGCHHYDYSYAITVPSGSEFDLEVFLTDPRGVSQASDVILSGADPLSGVKQLTLCRSNTTPGRFTLHGTLYTNDGSGPTATTTLPDSSAKLTVPKKGHHKHHHAKHHKKKRH